METMEVFPMDIIVEILLKLPAKSLLRFKCVCKLWYNLLSDVGFAKSHLQKSLATQSNLHFLFRRPVICKGDFDSFENAVELNYPFKRPDYGGGASIIGCCNGLLCLWNYDYNDFIVCLYNPTSQTHKIIPYLPRPSHVASLRHSFIHGFGYDSVADDYKFVRILQCSSEETDFRYSELMVYSMRSHSWTKVLDDVPVHFDCRRCEGVYFNGNLHWVTDIRLDDSPFPIVSFNLSTHSLGEVQVPKVDMNSFFFMHVGVLDGCLCIVINFIYEFEILVMREYGDVKSWERLLRFDKVSFADVMERPIAFSIDRKELLVQLCLYRIASIDMETKVVEEISSCVDPSKRRYDATVCVENLLMLDNFSGSLESEQQRGGNSRRRRRRRRRRGGRRNQGN